MFTSDIYEMGTESERAVRLLLTAEEWTAFWTMALTAVTGFLVAVSFVQLRALRDESTLERTLDQCNKYQMDPVLDASLRRLARGWNTGLIKIRTADYRPDVVTVLNYLDSLASGCEQGIYLESFVLTHMRPIFEFHYDQYIGPSRLPIAGLDLEDYIHISRCCERWKRRNWYRRVS